jgi:hypothetical protein
MMAGPGNRIAKIAKLAVKTGEKVAESEKILWWSREK